MNHTKRTKTALMMAVMAMLSSTCYAGVDTSTVDAQQQKGNQAAFRWEAVNQEAKKLSVGTPQAEVITEKAIPIIITAADVENMKKKRSSVQNPAATTVGTQTGIHAAGENINGGDSGNSGSNSFDNLGSAGTSAGTNGLTGSDTGANGSGLQNDTGSGSETAWGNGTYAEGAKGAKTIDDRDTDLRIYPLNGNEAARSFGGAMGGRVVALPEPEPVAVVHQSGIQLAGKTVPLPPVQPVPAGPRTVRILSSGEVVELPPIEKVAPVHVERLEKIVELPPIHSVK